MCFYSDVLTSGAFLTLGKLLLYGLANSLVREKLIYDHALHTRTSEHPCLHAQILFLTLIHQANILLP